MKVANLLTKSDKRSITRSSRRNYSFTQVMKSLTARSLDTAILGTLIVLGAACVLSLALMPRAASATAVGVTSITATSSNVYTNTGLATTSRVTTGDGVHYQLTLGGTPLIAPQINIFLMGSTTMSGSGTTWFYATTSASVWTEGPVTFRLGVGGTAGDATTTITESSGTTNVVQDVTAPTLNSVTWTDVDGSTNISGTDRLIFTFSETMATTTLTGADLNTVLALSGSHSFSTTTAPTWNTAGTVLTVTLGALTTVATGDTVNPTSAVTDSVGIADATGAALTITDNIAPGDPTGLSRQSFKTSVSVTLASANSTDIHYTIDGSTPTCTTGTVYSTAITISVTTTLKAIGCDAADNASAVVSAVYTHRSGGGGGGSTPPHTVGTPSPNASPSARITSDQVSSIVTLLASFGADAGVIANVQAALSGGTAGGAGVTHGFVTSLFVRSLDMGGKGEDVRSLQRFLNMHGHHVSDSGPGSSGNETDTFGSLTKAALIEYQKARGITPAVGFFGPKTRAAVDADQ